MYFSYLYILLDLCKGKTTSNEFYRINLNLLPVFMFRINTFSTLGDNTWQQLQVTEFFTLGNCCMPVFLRVRKHFKTELKYVNLNWLFIESAPGSVNKQFFLKTVFVLFYILMHIYYIPVFYSYLK